MHPANRIVPLLLAGLSCAAALGSGKKAKPPEISPLDRYIQESLGSGDAAATQAAPGALWSPASRLWNLAADLRSSQVNDLVTIQVNESASAVAQGTTKSARQSTVKSGVNAIGGIKNPGGPLVNLASAGTASSLDGAGTTSRATELTTVLSARVTHVLPNGYLVIEGSKEVVVNSEHQVVTVRGVVRPTDLTTANVVRSDQLAQLELKVNGKGVVGDAVRRPFILYRLLLGLLPF
jgi:flagellar L-ring protein precursor FlgH